MNVSDTLYYTAIIGPVAGDETPANNTVEFKHRVTGSFDPNDLSERNAGAVPQSFVTNGDYLQYTVRFQNTGTDLAANIAIRDTLSSRLDASSVEMISASHAYVLTVENGNQVNWLFSNINLLDSNTNELASHGYVVYRIKPKSNVVAGETIHNTSSIYFDYNLPVVTNDAPTTVQTNLQVLPLKLFTFSGNYQNEVASLFWQIGGAAAADHFDVDRSLDGLVFNRVGTVAAKTNREAYAFPDDVSSVNSKNIYYRLKLVETSGNFHYSNILLLHKKEQNEAAVEVYPNPLSSTATVSFKSKTAGSAEIQILNSAGLILSRTQCGVLIGRNVWSLVPNYSVKPGAYFVRIMTGTESYTAPFIIQ